MKIKLDRIYLDTHYDNDDMETLLNKTDNNAFAGSQLGRLPLFSPKLNDSNNLIFAIMFNAGGNAKLIGRVSLEDINYVNQTAELKICIDDEFKKKGFSYQSCKAIIDHGFNELNLHRVYAGTLDNNTAFQTLAVKLGMKNEGVRKQAVYKGGKFVDVIEFGIVKE